MKSYREDFQSSPCFYYKDLISEGLTYLFVLLLVILLIFLLIFLLKCFLTFLSFSLLLFFYPLTIFSHTVTGLLNHLLRMSSGDKHRLKLRRRYIYPIPQHPVEIFGKSCCI